MLGVVPFSVLARLRFFFNTNKTFLLPTALPRIRELRGLYRANHPSKLLVVGHADTAGGSEYNDKLSLDRAESVIAFLEDDVDAWLSFYETSVPAKNRWGRVEDHLMLISLPDFRDKPQGEDEVRWFQRLRKLEVDGKAGPKTRRQLVTEYMGLDGASLKDSGVEVDAVAHGCGEHFPLDDSGEKLDDAPEDDKRDPLDRRVELFFFDPEFGIVPAPPSKNSKAKSAEYPAWRQSAHPDGRARSGRSERAQSHVHRARGRALSAPTARSSCPKVSGRPRTPKNTRASPASAPSPILLRYNEEHPDEFRVFARRSHRSPRNEKDFDQEAQQGARGGCARRARGQSRGSSSCSNT